MKKVLIYFFAAIVAVGVSSCDTKKKEQLKMITDITQSYDDAIVKIKEVKDIATLQAVFAQVGQDLSAKLQEFKEKFGDNEDLNKVIETKTQDLTNAFNELSTALQPVPEPVVEESADAAKKVEKK